MKLLSISISVFTILAVAIFLFADFPELSTFNGIMIFMMLVVLIMVAFVGIIFNLPAISAKTRSKFTLHKH